MIIHPHELGMLVRIRAARSEHDGDLGVIDQIAIYGTFARGLDFTGWDMLIAFGEAGSRSYSPFDFDETEIVSSGALALLRERDEAATRLAEALARNEEIQGHLRDRDRNRLARQLADARAEISTARAERDQATDRYARNLAELAGEQTRTREAREIACRLRHALLELTGAAPEMAQTLAKLPDWTRDTPPAETAGQGRVVGGE